MSIWVEKAKKVKAAGGKVWDGSKGEYLNSKDLSIEQIAEYIREESLWECMSEQAEMD